MGIIDQFTAEGKTEIKITTLMDAMRYAARADVIYNGVKANVPHKYLRACISGVEEKEEDKNVSE